MGVPCIKQKKVIKIIENMNRIIRQDRNERLEQSTKETKSKNYFEDIDSINSILFDKISIIKDKSLNIMNSTIDYKRIFFNRLLDYSNSEFKPHKNYSDYETKDFYYKKYNDDYLIKYSFLLILKASFLEMKLYSSLDISDLTEKNLFKTDNIQTEVKIYLETAPYFNISHIVNYIKFYDIDDLYIEEYQVNEDDNYKLIVGRIKSRCLLIKNEDFCLGKKYLIKKFKSFDSLQKNIYCLQRFVFEWILKPILSVIFNNHIYFIYNIPEEFSLKKISFSLINQYDKYDNSMIHSFKYTLDRFNSLIKYIIEYSIYIGIPNNLNGYVILKDSSGINSIYIHDFTSMKIKSNDEKTRKEEILCEEQVAEKIKKMIFGESLLKLNRKVFEFDSVNDNNNNNNNNKIYIKEDLILNMNNKGKNNKEERQIYYSVLKSIKYFINLRMNKYLGVI